MRVPAMATVRQKSPSPLLRKETDFLVSILFQPNASTRLYRSTTPVGVWRLQNGGDLAVRMLFFFIFAVN